MINNSCGLVVVDVQNDFCPGGALAVPNGDMVVPVTNTLISYFKNENIIFTQDWHPQNHKSFASNNGKNIGEVININGVYQIMWPNHCVQNTSGADFHKGLTIPKRSYVVKKGTDVNVDSYSGFFDNQRINETSLHRYLSKNKIKNLFVVGLATDYCVKFTVLDALSLGYNVSVILDGIKAVNLNPDDGNKAVEEMETSGASCINYSYFVHKSE